MSYNFNVRAQAQRHPEWEHGMTYNVSTMLKRAGFHPSVINGMTVVNLRPVVRHAWQVLVDNPEYFHQFDSKNGWGDYNGVKNFLSNLDTYLTTAPDGYVMDVS